MASNLPVLRRGRRGEIVAKAAEEQAFHKAVQGVAKSLLAADASRMPGFSNLGGASNTMLARVTQDLAASFNRTPDEVEVALAEQGLSWGPPFAPGRPLDPFWGYRRPARTWDYSVGENTQITPRAGRISYPTLKAITEAYDVAQICIRRLTNDVRSLDYQFVPPNNIAEDATEDIEAAERFFATPDKRQPFRAWLAEWLQDVLRYDAGSLYIRRNEAGEPIALEVVNGTTIVPIIDFYGRVAADEDDTLAEAGGLWPGDTVPAYVQIIQGMPFNWLAAEDVIYQPWNPMPDSQYGLAPMEAVLLSANCFSADTECLTQRGWVQFPEVDLASDWIATRNPKTQAFEWQQATKYYEAEHAGDLYHFTGKSVDLLVTGGHRMLVDKRPKGCPSAERWGNEWRIQAEDLANVPNSTGVRIPLTSEWNAPDLGSFRLWPEHPNKKAFESFTGDDYAAFMGMWLAEGSCAYEPGRRNDIWISQLPTSKGFDEFSSLLERLLGRPCHHDGAKFRFHNSALASYLKSFGHAIDKFIPDEVLNMSRRQLGIFWKFYFLGDGCDRGSVPTITTSSRRMAGNLQEVAQKLGHAASVRQLKPAGDRIYKGRIIRENAPRWIVTLSHSKTRGFHVERVGYDGKVYCVSVPNRVIYVRRNGHAAWCGQTDVRFQYHFLQYFTEGTIPQGFMEAPSDMSDPAQVEEFQTTWDALMMGDQAKLRQIRWVPAGAKYVPIKDAKFDSAFPLYLMRRVAAAFGVTPNDLGFTEDVNRSTGDTQIDVQFRVGTLPLVRHVEDIINLFITEHLKLKARIQFDIGREVEDRLATAQAEKVYIEAGVLSADEVRQRLGKRTSRERPTPRFINNTRSGPIPILALDSLGGKVDPSTFGPAKDQPNLDHPFVSVPGVAPVVGSTEYTQAQNATANTQRNMLIENAGEQAPGVQRYGDGRVQAAPGLPVLATTADPKPDAPKKPEDKKATKALTDALSIIDLLLDKVEKVGWDNTGGPGVTRGPESPVTLGELNEPDDDDDDDDDAPKDAEKDATAGITAATGIEGTGLIGATDDGDEDDEEKVNKAIRRWRDNTRNRLRKNLAPKRFVDPSLPDHLADAVWERLQAAGSRAQMDAIFKDWRTLADPTALVHKRALELLQPDIDRLVASAARVDVAREALIAQRTE